MPDLPKSYKGVVVRGRGVASRDYNFPTANIDLEQVADIEHGVYAVEFICKGWKFHGVLVFGANKPPKFEVHVLNFEGNLIGQYIEIIVLEKLSDLYPYASKERMRQKILYDIEQVEEYFIRKWCAKEIQD